MTRIHYIKITLFSVKNKIENLHVLKQDKNTEMCFRPLQKLLKILSQIQVKIPLMNLYKTYLSNSKAIFLKQSWRFYY